MRVEVAIERPKAALAELPGELAPALTLLARGEKMRAEVLATSGDGAYARLAR